MRSSTGEAAQTFQPTPRELDVLKLLVEGAGDSEIARVLGLKPKTVSDHVSNMLKRSGLPGRVALAVYAIRIGLV